MKPIGLGRLSILICTLCMIDPSSTWTSLRGEEPAPTGVILSIATHGESAETDARVSRLLALHVPEGKRTTPFLKPGPFRATFRGFISIDLFDEYTFSVESNGKVNLSIAGKAILSGAGAQKETVELDEGRLPIIATFESPGQGDAFVRFSWASPDFSAEAIPPMILSHDPEDNEFLRRNVLRQGRRLALERRCWNCHGLNEAKVDVNSPPELEDRAPSLEGVGSRLRSEWMARWIQHPRAVRPEAQMPRVFAPGGDEGTQIAAYLATLQSTTPASGELKQEAKISGKNSSSAGKELFESLGCIACHRRAEEKSTLAEENRITLDHVAQKWFPVALTEFLLTPHRYYPAARMPNLRLSRKEAEHLTAYITAEASPPEKARQLTVDAVKGKALLQSSGCFGCHPAIFGPVQKAPSWDSLSGSTTRGCLSETAQANVPNFEFTSSEREALKRFLVDAPDAIYREAAPEYAERSISKMRCTSCHQRDGAIDLWSLLDPMEENSEALTFPPAGDGTEVLQTRPQLTWTGEKLRPDWLASFLAGRGPHVLRPWLHARMPNFSLDPVLMANGLAEQHGFPSPRRPVAEPPIDAARITKNEASLRKTGERLLQKQDGFACNTCHDVGKQSAASVFDARGPDLAPLPKRLRKAFFLRWLNNPQRVSPGTKMPQFANEGRSPFEDLYGGDASQQFDAIWQYLESFPGR